MRFLSLHTHVSFAWVGDRAVFLDLRRDRYFALDGAAAAAFEEIGRGGGVVDPCTALAKRLLGTGLFAVRDRPGTLEPVRCETPAIEAAAGLAAGASDVVSAWVTLAAVRRALRRRSLESVLNAQPQLDRSTRGTDMPTLAGRFCAARALLPAKARCLPDSLALRAWMTRRGAAPAIVFGVKLQPFAAHCWAQTDEVVLNDSPDRVREFTPVLVLP